MVDHPGSLATTRLPGRGVVVGLLVRLHSESGASGLILAVIEGERQICHILVVYSAVFVEHGQPIEGILQVFITISRVL